MLTPLDAQLYIDQPALAAHALALIGVGCGGVTAFGTTGEGPSFSVAERKQAIEELVARGVPAARIMVSTSCAALADTLDLTRHAVGLGCTAAWCCRRSFSRMSATKAFSDGYIQIIEGVQRTDWRLYLYHIPQVIGVHLRPWCHCRVACALPADGGRHQRQQLRPGPFGAAGAGFHAAADGLRGI